jgi:hypothetical protein
MVRRILESGRIAGWTDKLLTRGTRRHPPTEFLAPAIWPAITSKRSVQQARDLIYDPTRRPGSHRRWLLSDLMVCAGCGATLISTYPDVSTRQYRCIYKSRSVEHRGVWIVHKADDTVSGQIHAAVADSLIDRILAAGIDVTETAAKLDRAADTKLRKLSAQRTEGLITDAEFRSEMVKASFIKTRTAITLAELRLADLEALRRTQFAEAWASAEVGRRRGIVQALTQEIRVAPHPQEKRSRYDPNRITISWRGEGG